MIKGFMKYLSLIAIFCIVVGCTSGIISTPLNQDIFLTQGINVEEGVGDFIKEVTARFDRDVDYPKLTITNPYDKSIFPLDIASPTFSWQDNNPDSKAWLITISFKKMRHAIYVVTT